MKLRNKKTGEIINLEKTNFVISARNDNIICSLEGTTIKYVYNSLSEFVKDWENVTEEPKEYWYIDDNGVIQISQVLSSEINMRKSIGNYFDTREEAEQAVEKLKAWKRLKDKGFEIENWTKDIGDNYYKTGQIVLNLNNVRNREWNEYNQIMEIKDDLDLLFGGEE